MEGKYIEQENKSKRANLHLLFLTTVVRNISTNSATNFIVVLLTRQAEGGLIQPVLGIPIDRVPTSE